ncbi:hypothetical protein VKA52_02015 [Halobacillus sp. HZG1]|uniref:hypothetical protein n=1 Tax=Halobacillus sp. HZG1 TaxID=3111769 RepID=UPI002DB6700B|nr:hypothetical protein [Halobacillus sp. HZG1]MEC3882498.1 hypothetical protein [Halobacillus sp. HZG1]
MKSWRGKLIWLLPTIIVLVAVSLLFSHNYQKVTEPPDENWSRALDIGTTPVLRTPNVGLYEGKPSVSFLTEDGIQQNIYNEQYEIQEQNSYDIPVDKFTQFYIGENKVIYADYYSMYDQETGDKLSDIQAFFPLENSVFYRSEDKIFNLDVSESTSEELISLDNPKASVHMAETNSGTYLLTDEVTSSGNLLKYYKVEKNSINPLGEITFSVKQSEQVNDIQFTTKENSYQLLVTTIQKQSQSGKIQNHYYYAEAPFGEKPNLNRVNFQDPFSANELKEVTDLSIHNTESGPVLLFKANGWTETLFRPGPQFNIYQATISDRSTTTVTRLSNTPSFSNFPVRINEQTVVWVDNGGEDHNLLLASSKPEVIERADKITKEALLLASGKTMGMLSSGLFALIISIFWFLWPLLFMIFIMFSKAEALDQDRSWVLYTGILIYLVAAIVVRDPMFSEALLARAPDYLSFPGSPILFLLGFAGIAYGILRAGARSKDWSNPIQLTYFIGMHVLFIAVFFGPYLM